MSATQELDRVYRLRFGERAPYRDRIWKVLTRDFFQSYVARDSTILDLGAGWGEFIKNIDAQRKIAMDLNPETPQRIGGGVEVLSQDCSQRWELPDAVLDTVFTSNFFEHLLTKDALRDTLAEAWRCLKPGGRIICMGPNIRFLPGAYWDFWDHHLPLTDRSLVEGLGLAGFTIERCVPKFLPYTMSRQFTPPAAFLQVYLTLPFLWKMIGKQFLIVARKEPNRVTKA